jgi:hypothetical protein
MNESLRLFEIKIFDVIGDNNSVQKKTIARFLNELTPEDFGKQRFITQVGEVSVMNLIENGFSLGYKDIENVLIKTLNQRISNKNYKGSWIGINDAIRYFADLSPQGYIWHWEYILTKDLLKPKEEIVKVPENTEITFNNWLSLTEQNKNKYMQAYLDNPISGKEWIFSHFFS